MPSGGIASTFAGDLVVLLGTQEVASAQLADFTPDYRVTIDVQRFESVQGQAATLEAYGPCARPRAVKSVRDEPSRANRCKVRVSTRLQLQHSQGVAKMSAYIAAAIRGESEQKSEGASKS
jgi:uncharacterized lipoprotein YmbA